METTPYVEAVRMDLAAAVEGDPGATEVAERLGRALQASLHLQLLDALGEAAAELSDQLPEGHVEVRLAGRDVRLVLAMPSPASVTPSPEDERSGTSRLTLRLSETLKGRVETAAAADRLSVNAWVTGAIAAHLDDRTQKRRVGRATGLTGYARS